MCVIVPQYSIRIGFHIHANFSKSQWGILHVGTFRRTKNSQHFVVMLDCMQHNNFMCKKTVFCIHVYFL